MIFVGMWACQYRELRPIAFGGSGAGSSAGNQRSNARGASATDPEMGDVAGFALGKGRGRNRDGGGEYEMVAVKEPLEEPV